MIASVPQFARAVEAGQRRAYQWRKTPSQATTAGLWFDLSMSPGNPAPKYWFDAPPGVARAVTQSADGGLFHGPAVSPSRKYLRRLSAQATAATALPLTLLVCDFLLYYPSIDDSTTDEQVLDNTVTLPRYATGAGVQILPVSVAGRTGGQQFTVSYTNSDGVAGRITTASTQNTAAAIGTVVTSATATANAANPFLPLQDGDSGVRSIESVTMLGADVGLFSLILVKPLATTLIRAVTAAVEKDFFIHGACLPQIYDDAFLGFVGLPQGTLAATVLTGDIHVAWD